MINEYDDLLYNVKILEYYSYKIDIVEDLINSTDEEYLIKTLQEKQITYEKRFLESIKNIQKCTKSLIKNLSQYE